MGIECQGRGKEKGEGEMGDDEWSGGGREREVGREWNGGKGREWNGGKGVEWTEEAGMK